MLYAGDIGRARGPRNEGESCFLRIYVQAVRLIEKMRGDPREDSFVCIGGMFLCRGVWKEARDGAEHEKRRERGEKEF